MDENQVLIKIATDISSAVAGLTEVTAQLANVVQGMAEANKASVDAAAASEAAVGGVSEAVKKTGEEVKRTDESQKGLWSKFVEGAFGAQASAVALGTQMSKAMESITGGIRKAITALPDMIKATAEEGDQLGTMSARIGVSVESLSALKYVAGQTNTDFNGLARSMQFLGQSFVNEGGKGAKAIKELGLNVKEMAGEDRQKAMFEIIKKISNLGTTAEQTAAGTAIFGRTWRQNAQITSENIDQIMTKYKELGPGMDDAMAKQGKAMHDAMGNIQHVQENFRNAVAGTFLPLVNKVLEAAPALGGALLTMGGGLLDAAKSFGPMVLQLSLMPGGFGAIKTAVMGMIPSFGAITAAVESFGAAVGLSMPWLAAIAAALVILGPILWDMIGGWDGVKKGIEGTMGVIKDVAALVEHLAVVVFKTAVDWIGKVHEWFVKMPGPIAALFGPIGLLIKYFDNIKNVIKSVLETGKSWAGTVGGWFKSMADKIHGAAAQYETATDAAAESEKKHAKAVESSAEKLTALEAAIADTKNEYLAIEPVERARLTNLIKHGASTATLAEATEVSAGALELLKKSIEDADKAAAENPIKKLADDTKKLSTEMGQAAKAGDTTAKMMEEFGKKAAEAVENAKRLGVAFDKVPASVREMAAAWTQAELDKKAWDLATKLGEAAKKVEDLAKAFREKLATAAEAAAAEIQKTLRQIELARAKTPEEKQATQEKFDEEDYQKGLDAKQRKLDEDLQTTRDKLHLEAEIEKQLAKDQSEDQKKWIDLEMNAKIADAERATAAIRAQYTIQAALHKTLMQTLKDQREKDAADLQKQAAAAGITTQKMLDDEVKKQEEKLNLMIRLWDQVPDAEFQAQQEAVRKAKIAAGQIIDDSQKAAKKSTETWQQAADAIAGSFQTLAQIAGDSMSAIARAVGTAAQAGNMMSKGMEGMKSAFKTDPTTGVKSFDFKQFGQSAMQGAAGVVQGAKSIMAATDTLSTKKNVLGGMAAGAQAGMAFGPWGAVVGAGVGAIVGLFRNKDAQRAAKEVGKDLGVQISTELGKQIQSDSNKLFGGHAGGRALAETFNLGSIIQEAGGVTEKNVDKFSTAFGRAITDLKDGKFSAEQFGKVANDVFPQLAKQATDMGGVWTHQFSDIVKQVKATGQEVQGLKELMDAQLVSAAKGLSAVTAGAFDQKAVNSANELIGKQNELKTAAEEAGKALAEAQSGGDPEAIAAATKAQEAANKALKDTTQQLEDVRKAAVGSQEEFDRLSRITFATFNAMKAQGKPTTEAIAAMIPSLGALKAGMTALGLSSNSAFDQMSRMADLVTQNQPLLDSVSGLNDLMAALGNLGALDQQTFTDMQAQGEQAFQHMRDAGFSETEALTQMAPELETVVKLHKEKGLAIDEGTAALIAQAEKEGILKDQQLDTNTIMLQGLGAIIKALGGELPEAFAKMSKAGTDAATTVGGAMTTTVGTAVTGVSETLAKTPWAQYAGNAAGAAQVAGSKLGGVEQSAAGVQGTLNSTDWAGWSADAVSAANDAQAAINSVSFGSSPGGIKEIPIQLDAAMKSFEQFRKVGVSTSTDVKDAVSQPMQPHVVGGAAGAEAGAAAGAAAEGAPTGADTAAIQAQIELMKKMLDLKPAGAAMLDELQKKLAVINDQQTAGAAVVDDQNLSLEEQAALHAKIAAEQDQLLQAQQAMQDTMMGGIGELTGAVTDDLPGAFVLMKKQAVDSAMTVGTTISGSIGGAIHVFSSDLDKTPWAMFAARSALAGDATKKKVDDVTKSTKGVQTELDKTDWATWAQNAVQAAQDAQAAIDGVSFGSSPGGIKEIPLQLAKANQAFKDFEKTGVASADEVKDSVNGVKLDMGPQSAAMRAIRAGDTGPETERLRAEALARVGGAMADVARAHADTVGAQETNGLYLTFNVEAVNADGMKKTVEEDILPMLLDALNRNNRGSQTKLKQIVGV